METKDSWVILDLNTKKLLYGIYLRTVKFSSEEVAIEFANQFFRSDNEYLVIKVTEL